MAQNSSIIAPPLPLESFYALKLLPGVLFVRLLELRSPFVIHNLPKALDTKALRHFYLFVACKP